ncbi:MAG: RDD family protein [Halohasta sp.]
MSSPPTLGLFGSIHMDRLGKVTDELDAFVDEADAVFIEYPADPMSLAEYAQLVVRVPAYALGALLFQLLIYAPLFVLCNRDLYSTELVAVRRVADGIPIHAVDEHPNERLRRAGPALVVANWVVIVAVGWLTLVPSAATAAVALAGSLPPMAVRRRGHRAIAVGLAVLGTAAGVGLIITDLLSVPLLACGIVFLIVVIRTLERRNEVMLDRLEAQSTDAGYDEVVLVTGKAHLGGLAARARERGLDVPRVHVSRWLRAGSTVTDFEPSDLPTLGRKTLAPTDETTPASGLGPLARRVGAAVVDLLVVGIPTAVLWVLLAVVASVATGDPTAVVAAVLVGFPAVLLVGYHVLLEWGFGTTVGKRLFGLTVVDRTGDDISARSALARNLLRPVSLLAGYLVAGLLVAVTGRHQHLGDRFAGTVVVAADRLASHSSADESGESDTRTATTESTPSNRPPAASTE